MAAPNAPVGYPFHPGEQDMQYRAGFWQEAGSLGE